MRVISSQSFTNVAPLVLQGNSYVNIHGRLRQKLSPEECELFAHIQMESEKNGAKWLVADNLDLRTYSEADPSEKEEIAICIDEKKTAIVSKLSQEMNYISKLFQVPSEKEIFWYRDIDNKVHVILAQWGFVLNNRAKEVNIIDYILIQPRPLTQTEVTLHVDYSDGQPADNAFFKLSLFNNCKEIQTDENGDFLIGSMYAGKTFSVENEYGDKKDFTVIKDVERYDAVFDIRTTYSVKVLNQDEQVKKNFEIIINGQSYSTDDDGVVRFENIVLVPDMSIEVSCTEAAKCSYQICRNPEDNDFIYKIDDPVTAYVIRVMNQHEGLKPNFPILIDGQEYMTDEGGNVSSEEMLYVPDSKVSVSLTDNTNLQVFNISVNREENLFIYKIEEKEETKPEAITRIRILGYKGMPLPGLKVNVDTKNGKQLTSTTDQDGYVSFLSSNFVDGEKPKVHFVITKEYQQSHPLNEKEHGKKD